MERHIYPRVTVSTTAIPRTITITEKEDTRTLFVPFISDKGPDGVLTRIFSLDEFIQVFGKLSYERIGQTAANISNWLAQSSNMDGGTIYAYRLVSLANDDEFSYELKYTDTSGEEPVDVTLFKFESKYKGEFYNNIGIRFEKNNKSSINIFVYDSESNYPVETFRGVTLEKLQIVMSASSYIKNLNIEKEFFNGIVSETETDIQILIKDNIFSSGRSLNVDNVETIYTAESTLFEENESSFDEYLESFYKDKAEATIKFNRHANEVLDDHLFNKAQLILDAGYSLEVKNNMYETIESLERDDIHLILDMLEAEINDAGEYTGKMESLESFGPQPKIQYDHRGFVSVFSDQSPLIIETLRDGNSTYVSPTYYLAKKLPLNPLHLPLAGINRGSLEGVIELSRDVLTSEEKNNLARAKINYIERDSRGYHFMYQRTYDKENDGSLDSAVTTALSFMNNVFVKNKIVQDLQELGRKYLFEFNDISDDGTISNMRRELNKYLAQWVNNRILSYGEVHIETGSTIEEVKVSVTLKFVGSIEYITFALRLE